MLLLYRPAAYWLRISFHCSTGWLLVTGLSSQPCQCLLEWKGPAVWQGSALVSLASLPFTLHPTLSSAQKRGISRTFPPSCLGNNPWKGFCYPQDSCARFSGSKKVEPSVGETGRQRDKPGLWALHSEPPAGRSASSLGIAITDRRCLPLPGTILLSHGGMTFPQRIPPLFYRLWGRMDSSHFSLNHAASD